MKKLLVIGALLLLGLLGTGGSALAQGEARGDRACMGAFVSDIARQPGPAGEIVSHEARVLFHPFGQTVSHIATTCEIPAG